jgi:hypothetical protein
MNNPKRSKLIQFLFVSILFIGITSCCAKKKNNSENSSTLLRVCPEEWIQNKMPSTDAQSANEYFIYEGKRREIKEFDMEWVKKNCTIKPQIVQ